MDGTVRVGVRARPLTSKEVEQNSHEIIRVVNNGVILGKENSFEFDFAFDANASQNTVYTSCAKPMVFDLFKGYNITLFAYGQTGSGKTHTMGTADGADCSPNNMGIIPRLVNDLFKEKEQSDNIAKFDMTVSFLEIYNERITDLLSNSNTELTIREDSNGIKIAGLSEVKTGSAREVLDCLSRGARKRSTGVTLMNAASSRSHAILTLHLTLHTLNSGEKLHAKCHLVDLAGSERAKKTQAVGQRFREGVNINRGLLALGNVISALCEGRSHIPYRDSRLTRLLQDSLGGNSQTLMLACVSPSRSNCEETINTIKYAAYARQIKNKPVANLESTASTNSSMIAELEVLRSRVVELQSQVNTQPVRSNTYPNLLPSNVTVRSRRNASADSTSSSSLYLRLLRQSLHLNGKMQRVLNEHNLSHVEIDRDYAALVSALGSNNASLEKYLEEMIDLSKSTGNLPNSFYKSQNNVKDALDDDSSASPIAKMAKMDQKFCSKASTTTYDSGCHNLSLDNQATPPKVNSRTVVRPTRRPPSSRKRTVTKKRIKPHFSSDMSTFPSTFSFDMEGSDIVWRDGLALPVVSSPTNISNVTFSIPPLSAIPAASLRHKRSISNDSALAHSKETFSTRFHSSINGLSEKCLPLASRSTNIPPPSSSYCRRSSLIPVGNHCRKSPRFAAPRQPLTSMTFSKQMTSSLKTNESSESSKYELASRASILERRGARKSVVMKLAEYGLVSAFDD